MSNPNQMELTVLGKNGKGDPIIGWTPVPGCVGYRFQSASNYPNWSHTWNPALDRTTFKKGATPYRVQAIAVSAEGQWPTPPPVETRNKLCMYKWAANPAGIRTFEAWYGKPVPYAQDFLAKDDWSKISDPSWWFGAWQNQGYRMVYTVPMLPDGGGVSLATGATGAYNSYFHGCAQKLVAYGQTDSIIRLGHEFGGGWYTWTVQNAQAAADYAAYYRHVVTTMRAVAPTLEFDFNGVFGWQWVDPTTAYPGDAYVDYIGCDIYDQSWAANYTDPAARWTDITTKWFSINQWAAFAAARGKKFSVPEWGLTTRSDGHGGGDNASFITNMAAFMEANDCAYHCYFDINMSDGQHQLEPEGAWAGYPLGAAEFKRLF